MSQLDDKGTTNFAELMNNLGESGGGKFGQLIGGLTADEVGRFARLLNTTPTDQIKNIATFIKSGDPASLLRQLRNPNAPAKSGCAVLLGLLAAGAAAASVVLVIG